MLFKIVDNEIEKPKVTETEVPVFWGKANAVFADGKWSINAQQALEALMPSAYRRKGYHNDIVDELIEANSIDLTGFCTIDKWSSIVSFAKNWIKTRAVGEPLGLNNHIPYKYLDLSAVSLPLTLDYLGKGNTITIDEPEVAMPHFRHVGIEWSKSNFFYNTED